MDDQELLREYASHGSETAFTELVNRHLGLVYSTAFRRLGDLDRAEEVTQAVFTILAQKAASLRANVILAGWLYQTACFKAAQQQRAEYRRRRREQEAALMQEVESPSENDDAWARIEPLLDDAMGQLSDTDRAAILLRFFQHKRLREVGLALGLGEEAARKRVDRALTRLRNVLAARGAAYPTASIGAVLFAHAGQAAPAISATSLSAAALLAAAGGVGGASLLPIIAIMKLKASLVISGVLLLGAFVAVYYYNTPSGDQAAPSDPSQAAPPSAQPLAEPSPSPSPVWRRFHALQQAQRAEGAADESLADALARLNEALHGPPFAGSPNDDPARNILRAIPVEQRAAALGLVTEALRDPRKHVSLRAVGLVPYIWPEGEAAVPILFDLIRTKGEEWPELASTALIAAVQARSNPDVVAELVAAALRGPDSARRALTAQLPLLKSMIPGSDVFFETSLQPFLYSFDPDIRLSAAQALAQLPGPKQAAVLSELTASLSVPAGETGSGSERIRGSLAALQRMGPEASAAIPALVEFANENAGWGDTVNLVLKSIAPEELKGVGVPTPLPPLDPATAAVVRQIQEGTLTVSGLAAAVGNPETSLLAARALAEFGPGAGEALPALRQAFDSAVRTNAPAALAYGAAIERLNPGAPKPLLLPYEVIPALEAVHAEAQRANRPAWDRALETLPERVPLGMGFTHEDLRLLARELALIDESLENAFIVNLLEADRKFSAIFNP